MGNDGGGSDGNGGNDDGDGMVVVVAMVTMGYTMKSFRSFQL